MLKERGAEKSGYRGCLISAAVAGLIGAIAGYIWGGHYASVNVPDMSAVLLQLMFGVVGFIGGSVVGVVFSFFLDLLVRRRETEEEEF